MTRVSVKKAMDQFEDIIGRASDKKERIALTRNGKAIAVVMPVEDFDKLRRFECEENEDLRDAERELRAWKSGCKTISWERIKKENGL